MPYLSQQDDWVHTLFERVARIFERRGWRPRTPRHDLHENEKSQRASYLRCRVNDVGATRSHEARLCALAEIVIAAVGTAVRHGYEDFPRAIDRHLEVMERTSIHLDVRRPYNWMTAKLDDLVRVPGEAKRTDDAAAHEAFHAPRVESPQTVKVERDEARKEQLSVHPMLRRANSLLVKKEEDYGDPDPARESYFPFGRESYIQMLHTKLERLKSLAEQADRKPNFEGELDTALDLINYAAFYASWLERNVQQPATFSLPPSVARSLGVDIENERELESERG